MEKDLDHRVLSAKKSTKKSGKKGRPKKPAFENDDKIKDTVRKLKAENRKLKRENKELRSNNLTTKKTFDKNIEHIEELTKDKYIEEVMEEASSYISSIEATRKRIAKEFGTVRKKEDEA